MPAAATLADLSLFGEGGHDAIQVVLLDPHRLSELGDRDAGARLDQLERLHGARAAAARAGARGAAAAAAPGGAGSGAGGGGGAVAPHTRECALCRLQSRVLLDQRLQFLQTRLDLFALLVEEVCHLQGPFRLVGADDCTHLPVKVALPGPCCRKLCTASRES